jgi:hypothetical protein
VWSNDYKKCFKSTGPFGGCFDFFNYNYGSSGSGLVFSLLSSTTGLEKGTSLSGYTTNIWTEYGLKTDFKLGWDVPTPPTPEPEPKEKWYRTKPAVIAASVVSSFATIAVLLLIW